MSYVKNTINNWEVVIGLEIHAQILSKSKLMSNSSTKFGQKPNTQVNLVDAAMPGMLPVINKFCYEQIIKTGLGLNAKINLISAFDRKNYFYPDLPQGYQISQFTNPIVGKGSLTIKTSDNNTHNIGIKQIHLEQDAGKSIHDIYSDKSCIDLNRSGIALMEIVSDPDLRTSEQAKLYISKIRMILRYLNTCDGNMDQGSLRVDINISVNRLNQPMGTRCEIKNMNSIRNIGNAINYEANRQIKTLENNKIIKQETRLWNDIEKKTYSMRIKEKVNDYRYFPDPDLLPIILDKSFINKIKECIPELPDKKYKRLMKDYSLNSYDTNILIVRPENADYFEKVAKKVNNNKLVANWIIEDLLSVLKKKNLTIKTSPINADYLAELIKLINNKTISNEIGKKVFKIMLINKDTPTKIIKDNNLTQIINIDIIKEIINKIIINNPNKVKQAIKKPKIISWFIGQVMKKTNYKIDPKTVSNIIKHKLNL